MNIEKISTKKGIKPMQDNKTSSLQKHLAGGDISALETALELEPTI